MKTATAMIEGLSTSTASARSPRSQLSRRRAREAGATAAMPESPDTARPFVVCIIPRQDQNTRHPPAPRPAEPPPGGDPVLTRGRPRRPRTTQPAPPGPTSALLRLSPARPSRRSGLEAGVLRRLEQGLPGRRDVLLRHEDVDGGLEVYVKAGLGGNAVDDGPDDLGLGVRPQLVGALMIVGILAHIGIRARRDGALVEIEALLAVLGAADLEPVDRRLAVLDPLGQAERVRREG